MKMKNFESNENLQHEELEALDSIYASDFQKQNKTGGIISVLCDNIKKSVDFSFTFPHDYPNTSPPTFSFPSLQLQAKDSISLSTLKEKLLLLFEKGQGVIFVWIEFIRENMCLYFMDNDGKNSNNNLDISDDFGMNSPDWPIMSGQPVTDRKSM
jgi:hypothetical protein